MRQSYMLSDGVKLRQAGIRAEWFPSCFGSLASSMYTNLGIASLFNCLGGEPGV